MIAALMRTIFFLAFATATGVNVKFLRNPNITSARDDAMKSSDQTTLRICNVFAWHETLRLFLGEEFMAPLGTVMVGTYQGLAYKECADFSAVLYEGATVHFRLRYDVEIGSFSPVGAPGSVVLLVIRRKSSDSSMVPLFATHVFLHSAAAQVAVIDAYLGPRQDKIVLRREHTSIEHVGQQLAISDTPQDTDTMNFGGVWSLTEGIYKVRLENSEHPTLLPQLRKQNLVALPGECYVVIRCGAEVDHHPAFPETVVVYPEHSELDLHLSAAHQYTARALVGLTVLLISL